MELDYDILRKALDDMKEIHGITRDSVTKESGVHNIQKIVVGKIAPLPDSWWKLHKAFPEYIPEPTYIDGGVVYKPVQSVSNSTNTIMAGRDNTGSIGNMDMGRDDIELCQLLCLHGTKKIKDELRKKLLEIAKLSE